MKRSLCFLLLLLLLSGCGGAALAGDAAASSAPTERAIVPELREDAQLVQSSGERMAGDGAYIYYCAPRAGKAFYACYFGVLDYERPAEGEPDAARSLRRVTLELDGELELAQGVCSWPCLSENEVFFCEAVSASIRAVGKDGGGERTVYACTAGAPLSGLQLRDGRLWFIEDGDVFTVDPAGGAEPELVYASAAYTGAPEGEAALPGERMMIADRFEVFQNGVYILLRADSALYPAPKHGTANAPETLLYLPAGEPAENAVTLCAAERPIYTARCAGRLYYREKNAEGLWVTEPGGETARVDAALPDGRFVTCGGLLYYARYDDETAPSARKLFSYDPETAEERLVWDADVSTDEVIAAAGGVFWLGSWASGERMVSADRTFSMTLSRESGSGSMTDAQRQQLGLPDVYGPGRSELYLEAGELSACFRLLRTDGAEEFQVVLEPYQSRTVSFPCGKYVLRVAEGEKWLSDDEAFGPDGRYSASSEFLFEADKAYSLGSGVGGALQASDAGGFLR